MKKVSLKEFKEDLAGYAESAAAGEVVEVSKYNKPYIRIVTANNTGLLVGELVDSGQLLKRVENLGKINLPKGGVEKLISEDRDDS